MAFQWFNTAFMHVIVQVPRMRRSIKKGWNAHFRRMEKLLFSKLPINNSGAWNSIADSKKPYRPTPLNSLNCFEFLQNKKNTPNQSGWGCFHLNFISDLCLMILHISPLILGVLLQISRNVRTKANHNSCSRIPRPAETVANITKCKNESKSQLPRLSMFFWTNCCKYHEM